MLLSTGLQSPGSAEASQRSAGPNAWLMSDYDGFIGWMVLAWTLVIGWTLWWWYRRSGAGEGNP